MTADYVTDHEFEVSASGAYCAKCGRAYFAHRQPGPLLTEDRMSRTLNEMVHKERVHNNPVDMLEQGAAKLRAMRALLKEARERVPDWATGANKDLLARIDAELST